MTNKEAQIVIGNIPIKSEVLDDCYSITEYQEAKAMAIKALEQEPCEYAISRQDVLDLCDMRDRYKIPYEYDDGDKHIKGYDEGRIINVTKLKMLPSVNPQPKTGHWILNDNQGVQAVGYLTYHCSECGREICSKYHGKISLLKEYPYCHCGAKMVETQESEEEE